MTTGIYKRREGVWPRMSPSIETLEKRRIANLGEKNPMFGKPSSLKQKESARKHSLGNKYALGVKWTDEQKAKLPNRKGKNNHWYGKQGCWKGKKRPDMVGRFVGPKSSLWIADRSKLQRYNDDAKDRRSYAYHDWRKQVWLRDNFKCKIANRECAGRIEVHHILGWTKYPELRYEVNNGITLCHFHHPRKKVDEAELSPYFQQLIISDLT